MVSGEVPTLVIPGPRGAFADGTRKTARSNWPKMTMGDLLGMRSPAQSRNVGYVNDARAWRILPPHAEWTTISR